MARIGRALPYPKWSPDPADKAKKVADKAKQSDGVSFARQFSHVEIEVATAKSALSWIGFRTKYWKVERAKKRELSTKAFRKVFSQMWEDSTENPKSKKFDQTLRPIKPVKAVKAVKAKRAGKK